MESSTKTYRVADFFFTVEDLPFDAVNLQPFFAPEPGSESLFTLKIVESLPQSGSDLIYRSQEGPRSSVISLYTVSDGGYLFEMQQLSTKPVAGRLLADPGFKSARLVLLGNDDLYAVNSSLMLLFAFSTACKGALEMHSSVITKDGRGYLFLGKSGTGKSTHSRLWLRNIPGTELLNDDNPILRLLPDGTVRVYGSPWSGKTPCYKSKDALAGALIHLKQAPYNKITRLPVVQSYIFLMEAASAFRPIKPLADGWHRTMEGICAALPFYSLECLPDDDAALLCYRTVVNQ